MSFCYSEPFCLDLFPSLPTSRYRAYNSVSSPFEGYVVERLLGLGVGGASVLLYLLPVRRWIATSHHFTLSSAILGHSRIWIYKEADGRVRKMVQTSFSSSHFALLSYLAFSSPSFFSPPLDDVGGGFICSYSYIPEGLNLFFLYLFMFLFRNLDSLCPAVPHWNLIQLPRSIYFWRHLPYNYDPTATGRIFIKLY